MRPLTFADLPWSWNPWILASLAICCVFYARGLSRIDGDVRALLVGPWRRTSFVAGIAVLFLALISPFDALDDQLFSAHMGQHLVLMMIAPPLLLLARPGLVFFRAFPLRERRMLGRIRRISGLRKAVHVVASPLMVWLLCTAFLCFWHIPAPYGWAVESEPVHALEHICFFAPSLMFWSLILEPLGRRRLSYGAAMLFVLTFGAQNGLMGALLTFSTHPFYTPYLTTTAAWGLTPLEDQQLGGLGMWIPASLVHLTTLGILFVAWMRESERGEVVVAARSRMTVCSR